MFKRSAIALVTMALLGLCACRTRGPAEVREVVSSPSGSLHAAKLLWFGGATVGKRLIVAIFRGQAPQVGTAVNVEDVCFVFSAYNAGPWKMTWEGESQIALAIDGDKSYDGLIEEGTCFGVRARWFYARNPAS